MRRGLTHSISYFLYMVVIVFGMGIYQSAHAAVFQSQAFGIQVGDASVPTEFSYDNLIYGVMGPSAVGALLLLQNSSGVDTFSIDTSGNMTTLGAVDANQLCIQGDCKSAWPTLAETDTLQTVTDRGSSTTKGITVATINTGNGAYELYAMNQNMTIGSNVAFGIITATGGNSANWNTALTESRRWSGASTGLNVTNARASLGLGALATASYVNSATITDGSILFADIGQNACAAGKVLEWDYYWNGWGYSSAWRCLTDDTVARSGSGTANYIPKWTDSTPSDTLGNSLLYDNGTNIGINITNPASKLEVKNGSDNDIVLRADGADGASEYISLGVQPGYGVITAGWSGSGDNALVFKTAANGAEDEQMRIDKDGNVGINTNNPTHRLEVNGAARFENLLLKNVNPKPTCDASIKGNMVFDTAANKAYVCAGAGWKPLDSDYDQDGIMDWKDNNDNVANADCSADNGGYCWVGAGSKSAVDADLAESSIRSGVNIFGIQGTTAAARPGCYPGAPASNSGDKQNDHCDNDHDGSIDETDLLNVGRVTLGEPGYLNTNESCYYEGTLNVYAADGQFTINRDSASASAVCTSRLYGESIGYLNSSEWSYPCYYAEGTGRWYWTGANQGDIYWVDCNNPNDDVVN